MTSSFMWHTSVDSFRGAVDPWPVACGRLAVTFSTASPTSEQTSCTPALDYDLPWYAEMASPVQILLLRYCTDMPQLDGKYVSNVRIYRTAGGEISTTGVGCGTLMAGTPGATVGRDSVSRSAPSICESETPSSSARLQLHCPANAHSGTAEAVPAGGSSDSSGASQTRSPATSMAHPISLPLRPAASGWSVPPRKRIPACR
jgi:hypothetical protein